jgi:cell division protein FtsI/penicillin-binding protein 2
MINELRWRFNMLGLILVGFGLLIVVQSARLQFGPRAQLFRDLGASYEFVDITLQPPRGQIYDRFGNLLAGNATVFEVGVELRDVRDPDAIALALAGVLDLEYTQVLGLVSQEYIAGQRVYVTLAQGVLPDKVAVIQDYMARADESGDDSMRDLNGLVFSPSLQRSYPERDLASNILGFVGKNDAGTPVGYFGIEQFYDELLAGLPQVVKVANDPNLVGQLPTVPPGASLILTINREIQAMVEHQLDQAVEFYGAKSGTVVVMNPETGEILAIGTTPRLDLNEYWRYSEVFPQTADEKVPFNRAVSQSYEPGSVFKVITMAAALDAGVVKPNTTFFDTGVFQVGGITIRNWDSAAWGSQDMLGCLQHSLNVCLAWIGSQLEAGRFYDYLDAFGFGHRTGVDLAGEATGRLKSPGDGDWYPADLGTNTFGQGIAVTPIQMMMAVSALANDGEMVVPHLVKSMIDGDNQYNFHVQVAGNPISAETAHTLTDMLAVSLESEASVALVPGYRVAGKTGTGEIPTEFGYTRAITNASFVGWGPVDNPQFLVYVWLEEPTASIWGSQTAAPLFSEIVQRLVVLMNIPPDSVRAGLAP